MARAEVPIQTEPGRAGAEEVAAQALDPVNGHQATSGADRLYFEIINTHATNSITVTAVRVACPTCGASAEPVGSGAVTVLAGEKGFLGPLPGNLYGKGGNARDIWLDVTGTGTGTIKAYTT